MKFTEKMSNKLNELLEKNYDAEKGYKKAAENVENTKLKQFFNEQAQKRYDFGHEIKTLRVLQDILEDKSFVVTPCQKEEE